MQRLARLPFPSSVKSRIKAAMPLALRAKLTKGAGLKPTPARIWNQEFASGRWDYLANLAEMPRYAVIAGYHRTAPVNKTVLDVGCGIGLLQPWLQQAGYERYLGIDLSAQAIDQAKVRADDKTRFEAAEAESFVPPQSFDLIILNEMLYYMVNAPTFLQRYSQYLNDGGAYIVSLWDCVESVRVWNQCKAGLTVLDETRIVRTDLSWRVRLCRPAH
jgi:2-polyprenyl-3-methyl-5-hydroxy-6-metoxy-1,4-benzoquinol methylase